MNEKDTQKTQEKTEKLERALKLLILLCALHLVPKTILLYKINKLIAKYNKELPLNLIDRQNYIVGAYQSSQKMINKAYVPIVYFFTPELELKYETPYKTMTEFMYRPSVKIADPNVEDYAYKVINALKGLDKQALVYGEPGKRPITLWQKVELDIRHEAQMKMVEECYKSGEDLWWLSAHVNCSKRCEKWQGKLVSLTLPPIDNTFFTGKVVENHKVYSFTAIENVVDKWGYKNNIINGFNCRHRLIKYVKGVRPRNYDTKEISKARELENVQRSMERAIRRLISRRNLVKVIDKEKAQMLTRKITQLERQYRDFCVKYNLTYAPYRIM